GPEDRAGQIVVEVENRFAMRLHRHDDVTRVDLTDIHEGERKLVLVDLGRWDLAGDDPAEDAIAHVASLAQGPRIQMTDCEPVPRQPLGHRAPVTDRRIRLEAEKAARRLAGEGGGAGEVVLGLRGVELALDDRPEPLPLPGAVGEPPFLRRAQRLQMHVIDPGRGERGGEHVLGEPRAARVRDIAHVDDPPDPRGLESRDELRLARLLVADRGEDHRLRSARSTVSIALRTRATAAAEFHSALPRRRPSSRPCRSIRMLVGSPRAPSFRVALPFGSRYTAR